MPKTNPRLRVVVDSRTYFITRANELIDMDILTVYQKLEADRAATPRGKTKPIGIVTRVNNRNIQVDLL